MRWEMPSQSGASTYAQAHTLSTGALGKAVRNGQSHVSDETTTTTTAAQVRGRNNETTCTGVHVNEECNAQVVHATESPRRTGGSHLYRLD
jgi:hypothetical protein